MNNNTILQLWESGSYTEAELCQGAGISHLRLRRLLQMHKMDLPSASLSDVSLHKEVYNYYHSEDCTKSFGAVAAMYGISSDLGYKFTRRTPKLNSIVDAEELKDYILNNDVSMTQVMERFGISRYEINKIAGGMLQGKRGRPQSDATVHKQSLIADMLASGLTQGEVAEKLGVSQSYVSRSNPNKRSQLRRTALDDATWSQLKACRHMYSLRQLSSLFSISKSYIQQRLKCETEI